MLTRTFVSKLTVACGLVAVAGVAEAQLNLVVPGAFIDDVGLGSEWDPPSSPVMTEVAPMTGIYELDFDFDYATNGDTSGTRWEFKVLNDISGNGANWGNADDPELTPNNAWFTSDADGVMTMTFDTNTYDDGLFPATNRISFTDDIDTWTVIGNFQTQLGGATDYNNADANTAMTETAPDSGIFELTTMIPTPGAYNFRVVDTGSFYGIGTDQRRNDAANLNFNTFEDDQEVTFRVDTAKGAFGFFTEAVLAGDTDNDGVVEFEDDFGPIRDNFLTATNLRSEGDLDFSGFVDIRDFREWKNAFGGSPALIAEALAQLTAVPEPSSLMLLGLTALAGGLRRRGC
ncbi:hypothetical protein MalM25_19050 [Planctomycetes bacterium MalM25]|nr:hypothetical protein MalM25_19050 [Planctomycetes bacterium MalM25]